MSVLLGFGKEERFVCFYELGRPIIFAKYSGEIYLAGRD